VSSLIELVAMIGAVVGVQGVMVTMRSGGRALKTFSIFYRGKPRRNPKA
jgi:hypothetical protein